MHPGTYSSSQLSIEVSELHAGSNGRLEITCLSTIPASVGPGEEYADYKTFSVKGELLNKLYIWHANSAIMQIGRLIFNAWMCGYMHMYYLVYCLHTTSNVLPLFEGRISTHALIYYNLLECVEISPLNWTLAGKGTAEKAEIKINFINLCNPKFSANYTGNFIKGKITI